MRIEHVKSLSPDEVRKLYNVILSSSPSPNSERRRVGYVRVRAEFRHGQLRQHEVARAVSRLRHPSEIVKRPLHLTNIYEVNLQ